MKITRVIPYSAVEKVAAPGWALGWYLIDVGQENPEKEFIVLR